MFMSAITSCGIETVQIADQCVLVGLTIAVLSFGKLNTPQLVDHAAHGAKYDNRTKVRDAAEFLSATN